jgi:hypothetical protein
MTREVDDSTKNAHVSCLPEPIRAAPQQFIYYDTFNKMSFSAKITGRGNDTTVSPSYVLSLRSPSQGYHSII